MKYIVKLSLSLAVFLFAVSCSSTSSRTASDLSVDELVATGIAATQEFSIAVQTEVAQNLEPEKLATSTPVNTGSTASPTKTPTKEPTPTSSLSQIEQQVILDENDIKITAVSINYESSWYGPELKVLIENNSQTDYTVQVRLPSVNGCMVDTIFSSDVSAGKKANDEISFDSDSLENAGILQFNQIEFKFHIYNQNDWSDSFDSDLVKIETNTGSDAQTIDDSGELAIDQNGVKIIFKGIQKTESYTNLMVFIENQTDADITIQVRDESVNGFMISPIFSSDIAAGKVSFAEISFMNSDLDDNSISTIEAIELKFHVFREDNWDDIFDSGLITYHP